MRKSKKPDSSSSNSRRRPWRKHQRETEKGPRLAIITHFWNRQEVAGTRCFVRCWTQAQPGRAAIYLRW